jgi:enoyl-CoA hydratase
MGPTRLRLSKPVIAAIEGPAVAGGLELALWCDLRVAAEGAVLGVLSRRLGVPLVDLGTVRLPRLIGHGRAMDLLLTGRPVAAAEALAMGLVNRIVPDGSAREAAVALAGELAALPQACLRNDRRSAVEQWGLDEAAARANELRLGLETLASGETAAGARRFAAGQGRHGDPGAVGPQNRQRVGLNDPATPSPSSVPAMPGRPTTVVGVTSNKAYGGGPAVGALGPKNPPSPTSTGQCNLDR